ncbi:hypothetical protein C7S16_1269 [Burkholderia thailandensis]|uniref:Uncharacterized protein n=1 Tax=Burkholderia thailandensis TaxID=57975 RepID=A0AAW9D495_BURTH|nr:hypothetical protein [Burkholderia thailandensis]MDW9256389.1 hypothetical protein [Burkholderia thailandensis]
MWLWTDDGKNGWGAARGRGDLPGEGGSGRANRVRHAENLHKTLENRAEQTPERTRSTAA